MKKMGIIAVVIILMLIGCTDTEISEFQEMYNERVAYMNSNEPIVEKIVYDKLSEVQITSNQEVNNVIPVTASFDLRFDEDVTEEYVKNTFSIKPYKDLEITKVNTKYYKLTTKTELEDDQIYNIVESTTSGTKKWAFQTEKIFRVEYTYPDNNEILTETGVPEIRFNSQIASNMKLKDYISIEPSISGEWKNSYTYNYRFEHNKHFEKNTTYTIKIKKGLKDVDGNELKEDYEFKFSISNEEDIYASLIMLNCYKPNSKIDLSLYLSMNMNKEISVKEAEIKIIDLGSKENYIKALKDVNYLESLQAFYKQKSIYTKNIKEQIVSTYNTEKSQNRYYYYDEMPIDSNLIIDKEGYYLALLNINSNISAALFEVNNTTATCSVLSNDNFMILYKGKDGKNNSVDVYVNAEKLGTTNEDGLLYIESFRKIIKNLDKEINYIEFKNNDTNLICDISSQVSSEYVGENALTSNIRFDNGYLYTDRNYYKVGETIHFWGYAKNRKTDVKNATLKIVSNWDDVLAEIPLTLDEVGAFETEFEISNVNKESYISATLYIGDNQVYSRHVEIRNYELKLYDIEIEPESIKYIDGDVAVINISASTYDGTPLNNLEFKYEIDNNYYFNTKAKDYNGSVKTDDSGNAVIKIPLILAENQTNIYPETLRVTILNSYIDGEQESVYFTVYPYKHYAEATSKYIVDENKYYLSFKEYLSLNNDVPANDKIKVVARAYKTVKKVTGTRYNKYTKEMEDIIEYEEVAQSAFDKSFTVDIKNGKGEYTLSNYKDDKNCYYKFYAYLITDTGKELALSYNGQIYSSWYKTIDSTTTYEDIEYIKPVINEELTYTLSYETNEKLKIGDEVYFYLHDDEGRRIDDYSSFEFYTLVVSADGNKIYINKGERPHFTFTKEMGANVSTYTVLYDTLKAYVPVSNNNIYYSRVMIDSCYYWRPTTQIKLCDEELSLNIELIFDKNAYEPKDEAEITIKVTDKGKGVKASVNLSALDTAYIDSNGEVSSDIISSLINSYYIGQSSNDRKVVSKSASKEAMAVNMTADYAMEEAYGGGGDGSTDSIRNDLKVTAFFESVITDDNGIAKINIKLPDNITEWTIKAQAISNDFKAASTEKKIKVSKDFFVNVNHKDRYLVGEKFAFNIKSFSKKFSGENVTFKIEIIDSNGKAIETKNIDAKVSDVLSYKLQNPINEKGTYKIKITGICGKEKDILVDEIEITNSLLDATIREDITLKIGDKIVIASPKGYLYILNEDIAKILPTLLELSFMYNANRNDTTLISEEASRIFERLCNGVEFEYANKYYYNADKIIFKVMNNSSDDARLALRMLSTKAWTIDNAKEVVEKVEVRLGDEAGLWAKVNTNTASLKELRDVKEKILQNTSKYTKESVLYVALAFADIGSYDDAIELYNMVKDEITEKDEVEFELKVILAIKLNLPDMEKLYKSYIEKDLLPENKDFIKLYYVQNAVSKNYKKGTLVLRINGKDEEVEIRNVGLTRKLISKNDSIELVSMSDNLKFMIEQYKSVDFSSISKNKYIISKTYDKPNAKEGDMVEVTITVNSKKMYEDGYKYSFKVEDAIPNNMTFVEYVYNNSSSGYLRKQDGQKLTINFWNPYDPKWNPSATTATIKYRARVTNSGEQYEPGTILLKNNDEIIDGNK